MNDFCSTHTSIPLILEWETVPSSSAFPSGPFNLFFILSPSLMRPFEPD